MIAGVTGLSTYAYYMNPYRNAANPNTRMQGADAAGQQMQRVQGAQQRLTMTRPSDLETPVQPVDAVKKTNPDAEPLGISLPIALTPREGADPAEMAVRMRIQPYEEDGGEALGEPLGLSEETAGAQGVEGAQQALEDGKCETCEKRKYQDGSDDMSVSYQSPTNIKPEQVASAVRGHEMEHVVHEQAKAKQEDRKVVSQTVTLHTDICPECGKTYISGGETTTVTKANPEQPEPEQEEEKEEDGKSVNLLAA